MVMLWYLWTIIFYLREFSILTGIKDEVLEYCKQPVG